jgi:hypothetical protein
MHSGQERRLCLHEEIGLHFFRGWRGVILVSVDGTTQRVDSRHHTCRITACA